MIDLITRENGIDLKIKIHLDSGGDPIDLSRLKVDLVSCW
jgi:archaellin